MKEWSEGTFIVGDGENPFNKPWPGPMPRRMWIGYNLHGWAVQASQAEEKPADEHGLIWVRMVEESS